MIIHATVALVATVTFASVALLLTMADHELKVPNCHMQGHTVAYTFYLFLLTLFSILPAFFYRPYTDMMLFLITCCSLFQRAYWQLLIP